MRRERDEHFLSRRATLYYVANYSISRDEAKTSAIKSSSTIIQEATTATNFVGQYFSINRFSDAVEPKTNLKFLTKISILNLLGLLISSLSSKTPQDIRNATETNGFYGKATSVTDYSD